MTDRYFSESEKEIYEKMIDIYEQSYIDSLKKQNQYLELMD